MIARFVRNCPFCISRRNSSQSPSIGAPKTPSPTSSYPENNGGVPSYVYDSGQSNHLLRSTFEDDGLSYKHLTPEMDFDYVPTGPQGSSSSVVAAAAAAANNCPVVNGPSSPSQHYIPDPFGNTNYYYASQQPSTHQGFQRQSSSQQSQPQQQQSSQSDQPGQQGNNNLAYAMVEMGMHPFASADGYSYQQSYGIPYADILGITRVPPQDECFQDLSNGSRPPSTAAVAGVDLLSHHRLFQ